MGYRCFPFSQFSMAQSAHTQDQTRSRRKLIPLTTFTKKLLEKINMTCMYRESFRTKKRTIWALIISKINLSKSMPIFFFRKIFKTFILIDSWVERIIRLEQLYTVIELEIIWSRGKGLARMSSRYILQVQNYFKAVHAYSGVLRFSIFLIQFYTVIRRNKTPSSRRFCP